MALANVTLEIVKAADDRVAAIQAETQAEIVKINADADAKIAELKEKEEKRLKEAVERLSRQEMSSAELESKKIVLAKKKDVLSEAFHKTLSDLENAPADVKLRQYKAMVEYAKRVIDNPTALMSEKDKFTADELGVKAVKADSRVAAGLILQNEEGTIEVDMQYITLLQTVWDRDIKAVSDILFG